MKDLINKILLDMIPVILGILIALLIGNCKEYADDKRFVKKILFSVSEELKENKSDLEKALNEHKSTIDTINKYLHSSDIRIGHIISKTNGLRMINIRNTSWKTFLNSNMELIDYKSISLLTGIDESKENLRIQEGKLVDFIYENLTSDDVIKKNLLLLMINDLVSLEQGLLDMHAEFLNLKNITPKK
ncbi:MAG: hypothetical protein PHD61_06320 [Bacteroidales bacterium]|nr:hypothetical protein [Lentimicrobiaceae bacterium]MDD5694903.1 hypothetical protein [Bacteroidales bacterium]